MTVAMKRPQRVKIVSTPHRRKTTKEIQARQLVRKQKKEQNGYIFSSSLKASLVGGVGVLLLMLISLIPFQILSFLVIPGFLVVWLTTGMMTGVFAGDQIKNTHEGGIAGWIAGFWTGIYAALIAMVLSAAGFFMADFGYRVVSQFSAEGLATANSYGLTQEFIALSGRVMGALIIGVIGSLIAGLFSSIGGMIYPKLSETASEQISESTNQRGNKSQRIGKTANHSELAS